MGVVPESLGVGGEAEALDAVTSGSNGTWRRDEDRSGDLDRVLVRTISKGGGDG